MLTENQVLFSVPVETIGTTWGVAESMKKLPRTEWEYLDCRRTMLKLIAQAMEEEELTEDQDRYLREDDSPFLIQDKSYLALCNPDCLTSHIYSPSEEAMENFQAIQTFFQETPNPQNELEILDPEDLEGEDMTTITSSLYPSRKRMLEY
jgi:hypothetical protein